MAIFCAVYFFLVFVIFGAILVFSVSLYVLCRSDYRGWLLVGIDLYFCKRSNNLFDFVEEQRCSGSTVFWFLNLLFFQRYQSRRGKRREIENQMDCRLRVFLQGVTHYC